MIRDINTKERQRKENKRKQRTNKKTVIGIIDYGAGNTQSMKNTVEILGYKGKLVEQASQLSTVDAAIIPGVGAFPSAVKALQQFGMDEAIIDFATTGKGIIGVCLGMQLLADISYEQGETQGLGLINGTVKAIEEPQWHIGWNTVNSQQSSTIFSKDSMEYYSYYFNHSYAFFTDKQYIIGNTQLNSDSSEVFITAGIRKENIYGFQFHPEKSQSSGLALMKTTLAECLHAQ